MKPQSPQCNACGNNLVKHTVYPLKEKLKDGHPSYTPTSFLGWNFNFPSSYQCPPASPCGSHAYCWTMGEGEEMLINMKESPPRHSPHFSPFSSGSKKEKWSKDNTNNKNNGSGDGDVARLVTCLPTVHETLSIASPTQTKYSSAHLISQYSEVQCQPGYIKSCLNQH